MESEDIRRYSVEELKALRAAGKTKTDPNAPVYPLDADFWATARVVMPDQGKAPVNLRVDRDVLDWFRQQGKGHLTRMNAVLRSYVEAQKQQKPVSSYPVAPNRERGSTPAGSGRSSADPANR